MMEIVDKILGSIGLIAFVLFLIVVVYSFIVFFKDHRK